MTAETTNPLSEFSLDEIVEFMMSEEYSQLDELSKSILGDYIQKAADSKAKALSKGDANTYGKRTKGIAIAVKKLTEEQVKTQPVVESVVFEDLARSFLTEYYAEFVDNLVAEQESVSHNNLIESAKGIVMEAFVRPDSRSILPASQALHSKAKSTLADVGDTWGDKMTVQVAEKENGKHVYIAGSGHDKHEAGVSFNAHHDQTFRHMGNHKVVNTIHLDGGKVVHQENDIGTTKAHPLYVYK